MTSESDLSPQDWDAHTRRFREAPGGLWRAYCDGLHLRLIDEWIPEVGSTVLKTDLFDESIGEGLLGRVGPNSSRFGLDISLEVTRDARQRHDSIRAVVADLRNLPLTNGAIDSVISNSSLDHFETETEILQALGELHRVLVPGGRLLVTLDNPVCAVIVVRRLLPYRLLHRLGILPYPVGATMSLRRLVLTLEELGFTIERRRVIMHIPRVLAVPLCRKLDRSSGSPRPQFVARMLSWESLNRIPTRQITGHFVAVLARKR